MLRNVNLHSRSECQTGVTETCITRGCRWRTELGGTFLGVEDGKDSVDGPSQRMYLAESSVETSTECSQSTIEARRAGREQHRVQK